MLPAATSRPSNGTAAVLRMTAIRMVSLLGLITFSQRCTTLRS